MAAKSSDEAGKIRLDKWLWAARFFKTRSQASDAVGSGKILVNGGRAKPARVVHIGDTLSIRRGPYEHIVIVQGLSEQRGPASVAIRLYEETADSVAKREALAAQLKLHNMTNPRPPTRPDKRNRRRIVRFTDIPKD